MLSKKTKLGRRVALSLPGISDEAGIELVALLNAATERCGQMIASEPINLLQGREAQEVLVAHLMMVVALAQELNMQNASHTLMHVLQDIADRGELPLKFTHVEQRIQ